ncbi:DNA (cytosine-5-)-methyltransferase [Longimicrobium sp.]|uniref:DNA (cytosine-5-)-methyltransferase n=1 Tax=Longimicrobium sp. TaxID=2029185 RepID=UPI0039C91555
MDLGLERAGMRVVWQSEIDPYAVRVLAKHWPGVPNHGDITQIDFTAVESVDVLCGGFPCQDISLAGAGAGMVGTRSGLWKNYAAAIRTVRPRYVLVENVAALVVRGLGTVLGDLAALGYDAEWDVIPACFLGAPHLRERLFIVAYPHCVGRYARPVLPGITAAAAQAQSIARVSDWRLRGELRRSPGGRVRLFPDPQLVPVDDGLSARLVRLGWAKRLPRIRKRRRPPGSRTRGLVDRRPRSRDHDLSPRRLNRSNPR